MPEAIIIGGTGQTGHALSRRLTDDGWRVTITSRHHGQVPPGCEHAIADARDEATLTKLAGTNTDLIISCVAYDAGDARVLASASRAAGRVVAISTASVYCDADGRFLDEAATNGFPEYAIPLTEHSPTVTPGDATYSARKAAMEATLLREAACPVTILRPGAIHGPESTHAREWWFVKRLLDGRRTIPLAYGGQSRFQTTAADVIAEAVVRSAANELPAIANVRDADCPSVAEIGQAIMAIMGVEATLYGLPDSLTYPPAHGATPWSIPHPLTFTAAAASTATYAQSVEAAIRWLLDTVDRHDWRERLPVLASYPDDMFDYQADEEALALQGAMPL